VLILAVGGWCGSTDTDRSIALAPSHRTRDARARPKATRDWSDSYDCQDRGRLRAACTEGLAGPGADLSRLCGLPQTALQGLHQSVLHGHHAVHEQTQPDVVEVGAATAATATTTANAATATATTAAATVTVTTDCDNTLGGGQH
jgi:hypothetical protein